jgi:murein DD-endopeptidase MepM/ murein hydrolase activator NlpD
MVKRRAIVPYFGAHIFLFLAGSLFGVVTSAGAQGWTVRKQPISLVNGAPVFFQVRAPSQLSALNGSWMGHALSFNFNAANQTWFALAGVSLDTKPGEYPLDLTGKLTVAKDGVEEVSCTCPQKVARALYPKTKAGLGVSRKFTEPDAAQQKQIQEGQQVKEEYLNRITPEREWSGDFIAPVDTAISGVFGSQRIFNGKVLRSHLGLDFRAPSGTAITAMNGGTVALARMLYFEGNLVVVDHGQGLQTLYMHLSELKVKEGDRVRRGQVIGLSGGTGRATGPHLHVAVRWQDTYVDPSALMRLHLPGGKD